MSSKKTKLLESAQKNVLKGQYDRAIMEYRELIQLDPSDLRHRQKVAEVLAKANLKEEAIKEYSFLAKHYAESLHYLKAIAVYKQIQKLDPVNPETSLTLASLNEKQGLIGNATAEYASAVQIYEKTGENLKALKALESMITLDSSNYAVKLRIAEKYFTTGSEDKSFESFVSLLGDLKDRNDENGFNLISERAASLFGDRINAILEQITYSDTCENLPVEAPSPIPAVNVTDQPKPVQSEPAPAKISIDSHVSTDFPAEVPESLPYEDIEYIEDIIPIDEDHQIELSSISEVDDDWEEEIDLLTLDTDIKHDEEQNLNVDILEELDSADELDELELELLIDDELSLEPSTASGISSVMPEDTFDLGKDLSIFADEIDFDLFSTQDAGKSFDITNSGFKKGDLDNEDAESHYSLGLAYKEMGLFDEAMGEFIVASRSRERKIDSLTLQGVCLREIGNLDKAVEMLSDTLQCKEISEDERLGVQYEIALCHEASGNFKEARIMLTNIIAARPRFSDVATRLRNLPA